MFIENVKDAWKFLSVQWSAICTTAALVWMTMPDDKQSAILSLLPFVGPERGSSVLVAIGFGVAIFARLKAQPKLH